MNATTATDNYAGLARRSAAFALDYLVIAGYLIILTLVSLGLGRLVPVAAALSNPLVADGLTFLTLVLPVILYFTLQESSSRQATWGKGKLDLRVVTANGEKLTIPRAFVRSLIKFFPWQLAHTSIYHIPGWPLSFEEPTPVAIAGLTLVWVLVGAYILSALISRRNRTLYDWVSGAYVVALSPAGEAAADAGR